MLLKDADRERPPKSDSFAPLMAMIGSPEPSNFSACKDQKIMTSLLNAWDYLFIYSFIYFKWGKVKVASSGGRETTL